MEARMARIESMMEALVQDRGIGITPRGSIEREEAISDGFETFGANLVPGKQTAFPFDSPDSRHRLSISSPSGSELTASIRIGSKTLAFPNTSDYQKYVNLLFTDVNPYNPCVNEGEFRARGEQMLVSRVIHPSEVSFLALNYILFACVDILFDVTPPGVNSKPPGWHWFQIADELVGKRKLSGRGDLGLIQFLLWEVRMFTSRPLLSLIMAVLCLFTNLLFLVSIALLASTLSLLQSTKQF
jgi:hypothetical protein